MMSDLFFSDMHRGVAKVNLLGGQNCGIPWGFTDF